MFPEDLDWLIMLLYIATAIDIVVIIFHILNDPYDWATALFISHYILGIPWYIWGPFLILPELPATVVAIILPMTAWPIVNNILHRFT